MVRVFTSLITVGALALAACGGPTPYQPAGDSSRYGYSEQRIESDRYLVTFSGNSLTDRETVETFLLYRAAELTLERGYDHFRVVRRTTDEERRYTGTGPYYGPYVSRFSVHYRYFHPHYGWYGWRDPFWDDVNVRETTRYEAVTEIVMGSGETPDDPDVFDAREVVENLGPRLVRPDDGA
ncbi:hypothetical protein DDZ18_02095 [Marinicauda salina]|uniref:DUF4136 domain-containing protein n=1 Tax=Marinicauda salina TaxID=2135793 RepID=A0A2U2BWR0_9PROT|nr:hypothetical protein [Marinicauda salina]PWE18420.1 hypothetical protein DDZ18_02095 [Marinicauda salina]